MSSAEKEIGKFKKAKGYCGEEDDLEKYEESGIEKEICTELMWERLNEMKWRLCLRAKRINSPVTCGLNVGHTISYLSLSLSFLSLFLSPSVVSTSFPLSLFSSYSSPSSLNSFYLIRFLLAVCYIIVSPLRIRSWGVQMVYTFFINKFQGSLKRSLSPYT